MTGGTHHSQLVNSCDAVGLKFFNRSRVVSMSRSPLYKLFEAEGGVYAYIRNQRLALAMQVLSSTQGSRRPTIAQLAFSAGFQNERVFSRAFRRKYGVNPSAVDGTAGAAANEEHTSRLLSWMKDL